VQKSNSTGFVHPILIGTASIELEASFRSCRSTGKCLSRSTKNYCYFDQVWSGRVFGRTPDSAIVSAIVTGHWFSGEDRRFDCRQKFAGI